jgi:hypothetical protein
VDQGQDAKRSLRTILRIIQLHLTCKHSSFTHLHQEQNRRCSDFFPTRNYLIADPWPDIEILERSTIDRSSGCTRRGVERPSGRQPAPNLSYQSAIKSTNDESGSYDLSTTNTISSLSATTMTRCHVSLSGALFNFLP